MDNFEIIKPGNFLHFTGTRSCMGELDTWTAFFHIIEIEENNDKFLKAKIYNYSEMKTSSFTFYHDSDSIKRICDPIEIKKYLLQKKKKLNNSIQNLKDDIELFSLDINIIDSQISKL